MTEDGVTRVSLVQKTLLGTKNSGKTHYTKNTPNPSVSEYSSISLASNKLPLQTIKKNCQLLYISKWINCPSKCKFPKLKLEFKLLDNVYW